LGLKVIEKSVPNLCMNCWKRPAVAWGAYTLEDSPLCAQCRWDLISRSEIKRRRWARAVSFAVEVAFFVALSSMALALLAWVLAGSLPHEP